MQASKPDLVLPSGREVNFDLDKITNKEFAALFDKSQTAEEEKAILSRVTGIPVEEFENMSVNDSKRIWRRFFEKVQEPLENPT